MPHTPKHIGVDIAKQNLVAALPGGVRSFPNTPAGRRALIKALPQGSRLVCEATGGYEKALVDDCHAAGRPVVVANPRRVRAYARSQGLLAKTDRIDASLIGEFADGSKRLREHAAPTPAEEQWRIFHQAREALVDALKREAVLAEHAPCSGTPVGKRVRKLAGKRLLLARQPVSAPRASLSFCASSSS
jgi:transposase